METIIFNDYGVKIIKRTDKYFIQIDSGESVSRLIETEISEEDAFIAQKGSDFAYKVIMKYDRKDSFYNIK